MLKVVGASWIKIQMSTWIIGIVLVLGIIMVILGQREELEEDGNYSATAYWNKETGFDIKFWGQGLNIEEIPKGAARIYFQPRTNTTGWTIIDIETQSNYPDWVQAYSAGMLEGSLSWELIYSHWKNTIYSICENQKLFCSYVQSYLEDNMESVKNLYENTNDPYWHQVYLFYIQLEGMKQGFEHGVKRGRKTIEDLEFVDFLWMNAFSDVIDLEFKFYDSKAHGGETNLMNAQNLNSDSVLLKKLRNFRSIDGYTSDKSDVKEKSRAIVGCGVSLGSTFVKLLADEGKLFVAHNTAGPYVSMLRMIKSYNFRYHWTDSDSRTIENKLTFSSYPGAINSMDDFYVVSVAKKYTKMVVAASPITVFNKNLWTLVSPLEQVLSGVRAMVANRLSNNGSTWTEIFSRRNSGTGNKEWMVVDVKKFKNITDLRSRNYYLEQEKLSDFKDILWVAEQLPGLFVNKDQTEILLKRTYWASYGLPFYEEISRASGLKELRESFGDIFSYEDSPLANIYRRDQNKTHSMKSVMNLMRSNSYWKDPFSLGNPRCAIGARGDIQTKIIHSFPIGVIDSKVFAIEGKPMINNSRNETDERDDAVNSKNLKVRSNEGLFRAIAGPAHSFLHVIKSKKQKVKEETSAMDVKQNEDYDDDDDDDDEDEEEEEVGKDDVENLANTLKPFNWAESVFNDFPHFGQPDNWDFDQINLPV